MRREEFEDKYEKASSVLTSFKEKIEESNRILGEEKRLVICMEECAELTQALSKSYRGKQDRLNLIEEIGDLTICIEALKQLYGITNKEINKAINVKIDRGVN